MIFTNFWRDFLKYLNFFTRETFLLLISLYATLAEDDNLWVQGEIVTRFRIPSVDTSDINYFEKLHDEVICVVVPEVLCKNVQQLL